MENTKSQKCCFQLGWVNDEACNAGSSTPRY
jgi:hypothetical protein